MISQTDIAIAVFLAERPNATFDNIARTLSISLSTAHTGVARLRDSKLMLPHGRRVNRSALLEFIEHGLRYVFPATPGRLVRGVPTAHSGPVLADTITADEQYVWPSSHGSVQGRAITPLIPKAAELAQRAPDTYAALSLVDAVRVGRARERRLALEALRARFNVPAASFVI
jgi:hypothetical protein